jgi:hypothetical protein
MKFINPQTHPISLVDGREVPALGEADLTKDQYEVPEQWRHIRDLIGGSPAADKLIAEARENPEKFDNRTEAEPVAVHGNDGGTT